MADDDYTTGAIEPEWSKRFNASDLKEKVKTILEGKLKDFNYNPQDFGGNAQFSNGLAAAPPALDTSIGVSTSMKPCASRYLRMLLMILERLIKVSFTSGFIIRST